MPFSVLAAQEPMGKSWYLLVLRMVVARKSPQPSPIPPLSPQPRHPLLAGPPVKRVLKP